MTPLRLVLAGAAGSAAADFGDQDPRGLTQTIIGSLVVRGNRLTLSNSSSLSGCELHGSSLRARLPAFEDAVGVLRDLGASVTDVELPPLALYNAAAFLIARAEGFAIHEKTLRERPKDYGTLARDRLTIGAYIRRPLQRCLHTTARVGPSLASTGGSTRCSALHYSADPPGFCFLILPQPLRGCSIRDLRTKSSMPLEWRKGSKGLYQRGVEPSADAWCATCISE